MKVKEWLNKNYTETCLYDICSYNKHVKSFTNLSMGTVLELLAQTGSVITECEVVETVGTTIVIDSNEFITRLMGGLE